MKIYVSKSSDTKYQMFFKPGNTWIQFTLERTISPSLTLDVWRNTYLKSCELDQNSPAVPTVGITNETDLTLAGQWEYAIALKNEADYIGGVHGYENNPTLTLSLNGESVTLATGEVKGVDSVVFTRTSDLLRPSTGLKVAEITTTYTYTPTGLEIDSTITWLDDVVITTMYWPMFPVKRDANISSIAQLEGQLVQDVTSAGFTEIHANSKKGSTWNLNNGLRFEVEILNPETALNNYVDNGNLKTWFAGSSSPAYNKLYFTRISGEKNVSTGEVWNCKAKFTVLS
jgi:hypothetical protein